MLNIYLDLVTLVARVIFICPLGYSLDRFLKMHQSETSSQRSKGYGWIRVRPRPLAATCSTPRSHLDFQRTQDESAGLQINW